MFHRANINGDSTPSIPEEVGMSTKFLSETDTPESDLSLWTTWDGLWDGEYKENSYCYAVKDCRVIYSRWILQSIVVFPDEEEFGGTL